MDNKTKMIKVNENTHTRLKNLCKDKGMMIYTFVDYILDIYEIKNNKDDNEKM